MPFPDHIDRVLDAYRVPADTKAALYDLYLSMGNDVLEVFADLADGVTSATMLSPDDTLLIREQVVERFLRRNHPLWMAGKPTASLWHPRVAEGRASGAAIPMSGFPDLVQRVLGEQPLPDGVLVLGRNAHYGGRADTVSVDVIPRELDDALAAGKAEGQQHTLPGSIGETSATYDSARNVALIWEVQPNVYKPAGDRNRAITKLWRRHRNWHLVTLSAAMAWFRAQNATVFVLRGDALAITHEVNPAKPVSERIAELHDRTVEQVMRAAGLVFSEPDEGDELILLDSEVMNHALRKHVLVSGARGSILKTGTG